MISFLHSASKIYTINMSMKKRKIIRKTGICVSVVSFVLCVMTGIGSKGNVCVSVDVYMCIRVCVCVCVFVAHQLYTNTITKHTAKTPI